MHPIRFVVLMVASVYYRKIILLFIVENFQV